MGKVVVQILLFVFVIIYFFDPVYKHMYALRSYAVEMELNAKMSQASSGRYGKFTPEMIQDLKNRLVKNLGFKESDIAFVGTTTTTERGQKIEATITVQYSRLHVIPNLFGKDNYNKKIVKHAEQMSERIIR